MAIYRFNPNTKHEIVLVPYQYIAATGNEARHNTPLADKAVDERGNPKTEYSLVRRSENRLLYTAAADYDTTMTADQRSRALWVPSAAPLDRFVAKGSLVQGL